MTFTAISTVDIPIQPGVKAYNFEASGAILKGQAVTITADNQVGVPGDATCFLAGIAAYSVTTAGDDIAIYGPYNIVNARISGSITVGSFVGPTTEGYLHTSTYSGAIVTKAAAASCGIGEVLLVPSIKV